MHTDPLQDEKFVRIIEILPSITKDPFGWFNEVFEVAILGKHEMCGYRNRVYANLRFIASLQFTAILLLIFLLFMLPFLCIFVDKISKMKPDDLISIWMGTIITFGSICGGVFWKEKTSIHSKWQYLAGLYNEVIKTPHTIDEKDYRKREILEIALSIDILKMDMWAHESFGVVFKDCLEAAIRFYAVPSSSGEFMICHLSDTGISRYNANAYLSRYHSHLLSQNYRKLAA